MSDVVHLLWYSSDGEARAAIERMKDKTGFAECPQGFEVCPYTLDRDHWTDGFVVDGKRELPRWLGQCIMKELPASEN